MTKRQAKGLAAERQQLQVRYERAVDSGQAAVAAEVDTAVLGIEQKLRRAGYTRMLEG